MFSNDESEWVHRQTNSVLTSEREVDIAMSILAKNQFNIQADRWKNWDQFLALANTVYRCRKDAPILDAGACRSVGYPQTYLPGLAKLGFKRLHGCNLDEKQKELDAGVTYQYGDITQSPYPNAMFQFVSCLSVIEHGVNWRAFFEDAWRILLPKGCMFVSFDYWRDYVDTGDRTAFGAPVQIFNAEDVLNMVLYAQRLGFSCPTAGNFQSADKVVNWLGLNYTFCNLLFRKR